MPLRDIHTTYLDKINILVLIGGEFGELINSHPAMAKCHAVGGLVVAFFIAPKDGAVEKQIENEK